MGDLDLLDAINYGSHSYAAGEIAKKLKKNPNKSYYYALDSYNQLLLGNTAVASKKALDLKSKTPSDPQTLDLLYDIFQRCGMPLLAKEVYENAARKYPTESVLDAWFSKALEQFDYLMIQKAAMALQKSSKNRLYVLGAAVTCLTLSNNTAANSALFELLGLKLISGLGPETTQEKFVLASILLKQRLFGQVVDALKNTARDLDLTILYLGALYEQKEWKMLYDEAHDLLFNKDFNDFDTWKYLIKAAAELKTPVDVLRGLVKLESRNGYLAAVEIETVYGNGTENAILAYFEQYKTRLCCVPDLKNYASESLEVAAFVLKISQAASETVLASSPEKLTPHGLTVVANHEKFRLLYSEEKDVNSALFRHKNPEFNDLVILKMLQNTSVSSSTEEIVKNVIILEKLLELDTSNYKLRLWLINLYNLVNCHSLANFHYQSLKIKMLQHDTLGYKVIHDLNPNLHSLNHLVEIFKFYLTSDLEVNGNVSKAFKKGIFTKVEDFLQFGIKLRNSLSRNLLIVEMLRITRILSNEYYNYFLKIAKAKKYDLLENRVKFHDNRDFKTEAKLGVPVVNNLNLQQGTKKGDEYVKLAFFRELILAEKDAAEMEKLVTAFEKVLGHPETISQLTEFEQYLNAAYLAVFRSVFLKKGSENDVTGILNVSKIKGFLKGPLLYTANHVSIAVYDLLKTISKVSKNKEVSKHVNFVIRELANFKQPNPLAALRKGLVIPEEFGVTQLDVDATLDSIEVSLKNSTFRVTK